MENATINQNWKALIKPNKLKIENNEDKSITTVIAEPLEKGYALTIGNSLRRILLSSIQGSAISAIQIDGVLHEFSSIKGVREDVTDIVLNVKNLAIKSESNEPKKLVLDANGPKEIKAKDIALVSDVQILNPEQTICNLLGLINDFQFWFIVTFGILIIPSFFLEVSSHYEALELYLLL